MSDSDSNAVLSVIASPIGNLEDITYRAVRTLKEADIVYCEDTRNTSVLLNHYEIRAKLKSFRVHRIQEDTASVLKSLGENLKVGFITDAGTPGLSDPGSHLIRAVRQELPHVKIEPIPGPSALTTALSVSGWKVNPVVFLGFLSVKSGKRRKELAQYADFEGIIVLFESVHRVEKTYIEIREVFSGREILLAREMTKRFEEYRWLKSEDAFPETMIRKGEFTILVGPVRKENRQTEL